MISLFVEILEDLMLSRISSRIDATWLISLVEL